jgi:thiol-disulfide isomerase/thioredoxin
MDYHDKVIILNKYFNKFAEERKIDDMKQTIKSMKAIHGKIIHTMLEVNTTHESNKMEVLSDLQIVSNKMSNIIDVATSSYDTMMGENENKKHLKLREDAEIKLNGVTDSSKKVNKDAPSLILFYADWCGPCKAFLPTWNQLESTLVRDDLNIVKFSCVEHKEKCDKIPFITSFPTVVLYKPGDKKIEKFTGNREPSTIVDFLNKQLNMDIKL